MGCFLDADRPGVVLPALRHWPLQLRVPLALPELLVQQALRVWVLPLPVLPELAEQLLGQVPQRALASRSFRATGASIVEEADFTNSPSSCSFATAVLLSIPSSFATSYTRALATVLRPGPGACSDPIRAYTGS